MNTAFGIPVFRSPPSPDPCKVLADFFHNYPGKLSIGGPKDRVTPAVVARLIAAFKRALDQTPDRSPRSEIYRDGPFTLCYTPNVKRLYK